MSAMSTQKALLGSLQGDMCRKTAAQHPTGTPSPFRWSARRAWCQARPHRPLLAPTPALHQPIVPLPTDKVTSWSWTGEDQFTPLGDRQDAPPLPLPALAEGRRVVLVRHGQSTWNARNRMQGSSDFSVLTTHGFKQAYASGKLLKSMEFDVMFHSPLVRAVQTADAVWKGRGGPRVQLPQLREVDLYSFQGLEKVEAKFQRGEAYQAWQADPANFEIDGHAPVRELWYRASLAWRSLLTSQQLGQRGGLVVAHNAVNQALICTALGLPPTCFRRFTQTNAGFTVVDFEAGEEGKLRATVGRLNQLPEVPLSPERAGRPIVNRLILVAGPATAPGVKSALGVLGEYGVSTPPLMALGTPQEQALDVRTALESTLATPGRVRATVAVADPAAIQTLLGWCLEGCAGAGEGSGSGSAAAGAGGQQAEGRRGIGEGFRIDEGSITILNFSSEGVTSLARGVVLCTNFMPMLEKGASGGEGGREQEQQEGAESSEAAEVGEAAESGEAAEGGEPDGSGEPAAA